MTGSNHSKIIFAAPLDVVLRLKAFVATEAYRAYLMGVNYSQGADGSVVLAATDGHRLGVLRCDEAYIQGTGTVRIPPAKVKGENPAKTWRKWMVVGTFSDSELGLVIEFPIAATVDQVLAEVKLGRALLIYARPLIEGDYPNWRNVVPAKVGRHNGGFNPEYLGDFAKASAPGEKNVGISLHGDDPDAPCVISTDDPDFFGVLMPRRKDPLPGIPDWLGRPTSKHKTSRKAA